MELERQRAQAVARALGRIKQKEGQTRPDPAPTPSQIVSQATGVPQQSFAQEVAQTGPLPQYQPPPVSRGEALVQGGFHGFTFGFGDEIAPHIFPNSPTTEQLRERFDQSMEERPGMTVSGSVVGGAVNPLSAAGPATHGIKGAAVAGAGFGALEGLGSAKGSLVERLPGAAVGGTTGLFFGGLTSSLASGTSNTVRRMFERVEKRPTVGALRSAKNAAYAAVRKAGITFSSDEMLAAANRLNRKAKTTQYDIDPGMGIDEAATKAMNTFARRAERGDITLNQLDKLRQNFWNLYNRSDHPFVLEAIEEVDRLIATKADGNEMMGAARLANSRFSKAQLLENAFDRADRATAVSGSGGNTLNNYRRAVNSILNKPHEIKWFTPQEQAIMSEFVKGTNADNAWRRAGKVAPGGNGLMTLLHVYAGTVDPTLLAVSGAAEGARQVGEQRVLKGSEDLMRSVSTGVIRQPPASLNRTPFASGGAVGAGTLQD